MKDFLSAFDERRKSLTENPKIGLEFNQEMQRFLSIDQMNKAVDQNKLWDFIIYLMEDLGNQLHENR